MSLPFVQNYPDTRLINYQRNKDNGKLLLQQVETKKRITEEEEQSAARRKNLDPLQKQHFMPWEKYKSAVSPDTSKKDDTNGNLRKFMIDVYGQGLEISQEDNQKLLNYYQSLSATDKDYLSKQIKCKQQLYAMEVAKNLSPISLPRKSLIDLHKKNEFDLHDYTDNNLLKSFPVGNEKYFISEEELYTRDQANRQKYRDELHQTSLTVPIATTKKVFCKSNNLGKSKGFIDFDHVRDTDLMNNMTHDFPQSHYAELYNTLSLPHAYRNKIGKMECYK